ncbi:MAG: co-chaperone YbbN, partial [Pseudonocardiales bacterium]|nr:co-chaperone YbbN [Pseudonocardiales bacterium]
PQLREFLAAVVQAGRDAGLTGAVAEPEPADEPVEEPEDPRFVEAEQALQDGDYPLAAQRYQAILDAEPANTEAGLALRQVRLLERVESHDASAVERAAAAPDDVDAQLAAADLELAGNDADAAFARLIGLLQRTSGDERESVRQRLLEYFELLGAEDPRVAPARREMARVLF